jgi:hypothetical protein
LCHATSSDFDRDDARVSVRSGWRIVDEFAGSRYRARRDASILLCFHDPLDLIERNLIVTPIAIQAKRGNLQECLVCLKKAKDDGYRNIANVYKDEEFSQLGNNALLAEIASLTRDSSVHRFPNFNLLFSGCHVAPRGSHTFIRGPLSCCAGVADFAGLCRDLQEEGLYLVDFRSRCCDS